MTTNRCARLSAFFILAGLLLIYFGTSRERLYAQAQTGPPPPRIISSSSGPYSSIVFEATSPPRMETIPQVGKSGAGLTIIPTFNTTGGTAIDPASQAVINNAIAFYESTLTSNITVNIEFHNMSSGLGQSLTFIFGIPYSTYCTALAASAASPDDITAVANTPCGANPINGNANIGVKSPTGLALGLGTTEPNFGTSCPTTNFTGSGCIGLNLTLANAHAGLLLATVEHEIDEVLGLGSALNGTTTPAMPWTEDLFRWASAGARSYAANASTVNPCAATPAAHFSIDGGTTNLNDFNNCNNGGDYGDWITHSPPQVQDAFINIGGTPPSLTITSPEVRALDVIGFTIVAASKHRRGQTISQ